MRTCTKSSSAAKVTGGNREIMTSLSNVKTQKVKRSDQTTKSRNPYAYPTRRAIRSPLTLSLSRDSSPSLLRRRVGVTWPAALAPAPCCAMATAACVARERAPPLVAPPPRQAAVSAARSSRCRSNDRCRHTRRSGVQPPQQRHRNGRAGSKSLGSGRRIGIRALRIPTRRRTRRERRSLGRESS